MRGRCLWLLFAAAILACVYPHERCPTALGSSEADTSWDVDDGNIRASLVFPDEEVELAGVFTCEIVVEAASGIDYEIEIPTSEWSGQGAELVGDGPVLVEWEPDVWHVQVMPVEAGELNLSGPFIVYNHSSSETADTEASFGRLELPRFTLRVANPLEGTDNVELGRMKDPLAAQVDYSRLATVLACATAVAACIGLLLLLIRHRRCKNKREPAVEALQKPAHEIAYERLREIERSGLIERGCYREFHFAISECLREYLENRFRIPALEMTTEEFLDYSRSQKNLPDICRTVVPELLRLSDLVKFAKRESLTSEMRNVLVSVRRLVDETRENPETQEDEVSKQ